jgi:subtilisin family serine protease
VSRGSTLSPRLSKRRDRCRIAVAALLIGLFSAGSAVPAVAAELDPSLWYFTDFGVQEAFDAGYNGQGVTIAVIDSQINPNVPALQGANLSIHEPALCDPDSQTRSRLPATSTAPDAVHGTNMAALILGNGTPPADGSVGQLGVAPGAHVLYYASALDFGGWGENHCSRDGVEARGADTAEAIDLAVADGAQIISMSFTENNYQSIVDAVARALKAGVVLIAGLANDQTGPHGLNEMNGVVTVQSMDAFGAIQESSRLSSPGIDVVGPGVNVLGVADNWSGATKTNGTSNATAIIAGFLAVVKSKYPSATGNQLVQTLVRNTSAEDHPLQKDPEGYFGYGIVSLRHMLAVDPTQYPDDNPLIENPGDSPSYGEIFGETAAPPSAAPTVTSSPETITGSLGSLPVILLVVVLVVVAGGIVTTVLVVRARKRISR